MLGMKNPKSWESRLMVSDLKYHLIVIEIQNPRLFLPRRDSAISRCIRFQTPLGHATTEGSKRFDFEII